MQKKGPKKPGVTDADAVFLLATLIKTNLNHIVHHQTNYGQIQPKPSA